MEDNCSRILIGSLVLIAEANAPPGQWLLGRVSELHPRCDAAVPDVTLKIKRRFLKRNVHRICPLPRESTIDYVLKGASKRKYAPQVNI